MDRPLWHPSEPSRSEHRAFNPVLSDAQQTNLWQRISSSIWKDPLSELCDLHVQSAQHASDRAFCKALGIHWP